MKFDVVTEKVIKTVEVEEKLYVLELTREEFAVLTVAAGAMSGSVAAEKVAYHKTDIEVDSLDACRFLSAVYDRGIDELGFLG